MYVHACKWITQEFLFYLINMQKNIRKKSRDRELLEAKVWQKQQEGKKLSLAELWKELQEDHPYETHQD
jgi:hypothetical protein